MKRVLAVLVVSLCISCLGAPAWALEPGPSEDPPPSESRPPAAEVPEEVKQEQQSGSIGWALTQPDSQTETVTLENKIVIADQTDTGGSFFYIEEADRSAGIRVNWSTAVSRGDRVDVTGYLGVTDGERYINGSDVDDLESSETSIPEPVGMDNATVGGAALNGYTPGVDTVSGVAGVGTGPYNKGLLVRTWGRVCYINGSEHYFQIDDGTSYSMSMYKTLRVQANSSTALPSISDYVIVTGVSSSWISPYNDKLRLIRTRESDDITTISAGVNVTAPTGTIADPPSGAGYAWNLIAVPGVPYWDDDNDPYPYASDVFAETKPALECETLQGNLWRWDTTDPQSFDDSYIMYPDSAGDPIFGAIYSGEGYWIDSLTSGTISYTGVLDLTQKTDRYSKLPDSYDEGDEDPAGGLTLIGYPFESEQSFANAYLTDGYRTLRVDEAIAAGWIDDLGYWWKNDVAYQNARKSVGLPDSGADTATLEPWRGYWVRAFKPTSSSQSKIALVLPSLRSVNNEPNKPPAIAITEPGPEVNKSATVSYVLIRAKTMDDVGVTQVEVQIDEGGWKTASYDSYTEPWTYWTYTGWTNPSPKTYTIYARAFDTHGRCTTVSRQVTVTDLTAGGHKVVYVKTTGDDNDDGSTWALAKATVQDGLDEASSGDEVWVAAETYTENITLKDGVGLYGGFASSETAREQRDWVTNVTTLDGNESGSVVTIQSCSDSGTAIDGFTITDGKAIKGGGIYCDSSSPTIANNTITGNTAAEVTMQLSYEGGGIYCHSSSPLIVGNNVTQNEAHVDGMAAHGQGIYCAGGSPIIADNMITDNVVPDQGPSIGGGICASGSSGVICNNTIAGNTVATDGGGIYCEDCSLVISSNIVASNYNGLYRSGGSLALRHNDVWENTGYNYSGVSPGAGDRCEDPKFKDPNNGDYHIESNSPCIDAGHNGDVQGDLDIDGEWRIQGGTVDIGADETASCPAYAVTDLSANPSSAVVGTEVTVTATVTDPLGGKVEGAVVKFSVTGTNASVDPASDVTDKYGNAHTILTKSSAGIATVTACADVGGCTTSVTKTIGVYFYDPENPSVNNWTMFMHDPQHSGKSAGQDSMSETLVAVWSADLPTADTARSSSFEVGGVSHPNPGSAFIFEHPYIDSSPVVFGNLVIVGTWTGDYTSSDGSVKAFDGQTGETIWTATGDPTMDGVASTPCIHDGKVFVGSANGYLYCLNIGTGSQIWSRETTDRSSGSSKILSSPVVHDGVVYITNEASKIYAFTADGDGSSVTGYPKSLPIHTSGPQQNITGASSPAIATVSEVDYLLVGCDDGYLYRLTLSDLTIDEEELDGCVESSPTVVDNEVFVGTSSGVKQANRLTINPFDTKQQTNMSAEVRATMAHGFDHMYVGEDTGYDFYKLEPDDLSTDTSFYANNYFVGSAALTSNGLAYVGNDNGCFYALSAQNLSETASYNTTDFVCSSPAIAYDVDASHNRWVYVTSRAAGGTLLAFKTDQ